MEIIIAIKKNQVLVELFNQNKLVEKTKFIEERNISKKLLPAIDKILKKNKLNIQQLEKANFFSDLSESFTTYRVAKTIVDTINFAIKNQK